jgi:hypothetical protein
MLIFHSRMVASPLPDVTIDPSGLNAPLRTGTASFRKLATYTTAPAFALVSAEVDMVAGAGFAWAIDVRADVGIKAVGWLNGVSVGLGVSSRSLSPGFVSELRASTPAAINIASSTIPTPAPTSNRTT